ncbi:MAG: DNA alkylation repair protein [Alphaproteobacteria bacterium CG_4_10_14_0_2_um_filter_63_37]|nr:MAG: DNA alkylation repair protein [Alphaproteobacteria bacterium CG_4_10_14_0_2_um_filter_63_37]
MTAPTPLDDLISLADPIRAQHSARYFKTGPGQYGQGDQFLGLTVPKVRRIAKRWRDLPLAEVEDLLHCPWHEARLLALLIWVGQCERGDDAVRRTICDRYLAHTAFINNWDLVDTSAPTIVGGWLWRHPNPPLLDRLAVSESLWERRIAVLATFTFIKNGRFLESLELAEGLLGDREDLIHKAVGWMLREVGKRDFDLALTFVQQHCRTMPRTMLRYAIEKYPEGLRQDLLKGQA